MLHQSGGCCDGSAPMCFPDGEFVVGDTDVLLGVLDLRLVIGQVPERQPTGPDAVPVWISEPQFEVWKHTQLILDIVPGRGAGFSLESPAGVRFLSRARAFTAEEMFRLGPVGTLRGIDWRNGQVPVLPSEPQVLSVAGDSCPVAEDLSRFNSINKYSQLSRETP
ncbi:DUF779 domain-containing protein [Paenarthrobacter sp. NPDC058040]